jgi:hypothetical protein
MPHMGRSVLAAGAVAIGLSMFAAACTSGAPSPPTVRVNGHKVPLAKTSNPRSKVSFATTANFPATTSKLGRAASVTYRVGPSGPLTKATTITLPLLRKVTNDGLTVVFTSESTRGPWQPLATRIIRGGRYAQVTVRQLSFFRAVSISVKYVLEQLKQVFNDYTGGVLAGTPHPQCEDKNEARADNYDVSFSVGDTLYWCFGMENGKRVLKAANNRHYPLVVQHLNLSLIGGDSGANVERDLSRLVSYGDAVIFPGEDADFGADLPEGSRGVLQADADAQAADFDGAYAAVEADVEMAELLGTAEVKDTTEIADTILTAEGCQEALRSLSPANIFHGCTSSDVLKKAFGTVVGTLLSILSTVGELAQFLRGVIGDVIDEVRNRTQFNITVTRFKPVLDYYLSFYFHHDAGLCIGAVLDFAHTDHDGRPMCEGSAGAGWLLYITGCIQAGQCNAWIPLTFSPQPDGSLLGVVSGAPVCTDDALKQISCNAVGTFLEQHDEISLRVESAGLLIESYLQANLLTPNERRSHELWCDSRSAAGQAKAAHGVCGA